MFIEELKLLIAYNFFWEMISEKIVLEKMHPIVQLCGVYRHVHRQ